MSDAPVQSTPPTGPSREHGAPTRSFLVALPIGVAVMAFGVRELLRFSPQTDRRIDFAAWLIGLDLVHDLAFAPLVCGVGWLVGRVVRGPARAPVQVALAGSAVVLLLAWPLLRGYGRLAGNPSIQPLNYATGTATVVGAIWVGAACWWARLLARRHRTDAFPSAVPLPLAHGDEDRTTPTP